MGKPKNPHGLVKNQHFFPVASINRFTNEDGTLEIYLKPHSRIIDGSPRSSRMKKLFCARHAWAHHIETGWFKAIEDKFQKVANKVQTQAMIALTSEEHDAVLEFFALWLHRWRLAKNPIPDSRLRGVISPYREITRDQQDRLEKVGIFAATSDCVMPGRFIASSGFNLQISRFKRRCKEQNVYLSIIYDVKGRFIAPDVLAEDFIALPISPHFYLAYSMSPFFTAVTDKQVFDLNNLIISRSQDFFYGRDLRRMLVGL